MSNFHIQCTKCNFSGNFYSTTRKELEDHLDFVKTIPKEGQDCDHDLKITEIKGGPEIV